MQFMDEDKETMGARSRPRNRLLNLTASKFQDVPKSPPDRSGPLGLLSPLASASMLLPSDIFPRSRSKQRQQTELEKTASGVTAPLHTRTMSIRNFRTGLNALLGLSSKYFEHEMLGKLPSRPSQGLNATVQEASRTLTDPIEDAKCFLEPVLPEYLQPLPADAWPAQVGMFKKGTQVLQDQGLVLMKSLSMTYHTVIAGVPKEDTATLPFAQLPSTMYLTCWELIQAVQQYLRWEKGDPTFDFTQKLTPAKATKDHYLRKHYTFTLYRPETQHTCQLTIQYVSAL